MKYHELAKAMEIINSCTTTMHTIVAARWLTLAVKCGAIDTDTNRLLRTTLNGIAAKIRLAELDKLEENYRNAI